MAHKITREWDVFGGLVVTSCVDTNTGKATYHTFADAAVLEDMLDCGADVRPLPPMHELDGPLPEVWRQKLHLEFTKPPNGA